MQDIKWLIKLYMAQNHIDSISELARLSGLSRRLLYDRINDPASLRIYEIKNLDNVLHFSDEDMLFLMRGEKNELRSDNVRRLRIS